MLGLPILAPADFGAPVFVVGYPRSGTTLLATILDRHSAIAVTPETHFFEHFLARRDRRGWTPHEWIRKFVEDPYCRDLRLTPDLIEAELPLGVLAENALFRAVLRAHCRRAGKRIPAEKTPRHLHHVPRILEWFPDARILCIVRDGRAAALSTRATPWGERSLRRLALQWDQAARLTIRYEDRYPRTFLRLHYESLVQCPVETVTEVCRFLGLEFENTQLQPGTSGVIPPWEQSWKEGAALSIDPRRATAWRAKATAKEIWTMNSMMQSRLEYFGYGNCDLDGCPTSSRWTNAIANRACRMAFSPVLQPLRSAFRRWLPGEALPRNTPRKWSLW